MILIGYIFLQKCISIILLEFHCIKFIAGVNHCEKFYLRQVLCWYNIQNKTSQLIGSVNHLQWRKFNLISKNFKFLRHTIFKLSLQSFKVKLYRYYIFRRNKTIIALITWEKFLIQIKINKINMIYYSTSHQNSLKS